MPRNDAWATQKDNMGKISPIVSGCHVGQDVTQQTASFSIKVLTNPHFMNMHASPLNHHNHTFRKNPARRCMIGDAISCVYNPWLLSASSRNIDSVVTPCLTTSRLAPAMVHKTSLMPLASTTSFSATGLRVLGRDRRKVRSIESASSCTPLFGSANATRAGGSNPAAAPVQVQRSTASNDVR
jgi:hypothetical protein